jgi:hypothetical protein
MSVSPVSGSSAASAAGQADSSPKLTGGQIDAIWNQLLAPIQQSNDQTLGPTKSKQYNERMAKDLAEFKANNPDATEAQIQEFFKKQSSKHQGYLRVTKFMEDSFMKRLQNKAKEQQADRWS